MNTAPHTHKVEIEDYGSRWYIEYGDQCTSASKPWKWPWQSDEQHAQRTLATVRRAAHGLIQRHDRKSRMAGLIEGTTVPTLRQGEWGSDQLK